MTVKNLWAERGVSQYPLVMPLMGQKKVYENLREALDVDDTGSLSSFVVLRGEWGTGKSRIGHQLAAESLNQGVSWLIEGEEVSPLFPGDFSDKRLVFFLRYKDIYELKKDIDVEQWIPLTTLTAFEYLFRKPPGSIMVNFYQCLKESLRRVGVNLERLQETILRDDLSIEEKIKDSLQYLKEVANIDRLWIMIDEIEMPGEEEDIRPSTKEDNVSFYINILKGVLRDEGFRGTYPQINFILLSSQAAYSRLSSSGASERRLNWSSVEDLHLLDIMQLREWIEEKESFSYPAEFLTAAYFASGRNMGWFNILMNHFHQKLIQGQDDIGFILKEYIQNELDGSRLFDNGALDYIGDTSLIKEDREELLSYICRQVPIELKKSNVIYQKFHTVKYKGDDRVLQELFPVSMTASDLLNELKMAGYRESINQPFLLQKEDLTIRPDRLLKTLQGFSKPITGNEDFLVYDKGRELEEQLKILYPKEKIYQDVNTLAEIFSRYRHGVENYLGPSFLILQALNRQYSLKEKREKVFSLEDPSKMEEVEEGVDGILDHKRLSALVLGIVKIFVPYDKNDWKADSPFSFSLDAAYCIKDVEGYLHVEPSYGLYVLGYKGVEKTTKDLKTIADKKRGPVLLVFTSSSDEKEFLASLDNQGYKMQDLIIPKVVNYNSNMAQFLISYSFRGDFFFDSDLTVSSNRFKMKILEEFKLEGREWLLDLKESGNLNLPLFKTTTKMQKWLQPTISAIKCLARGTSLEEILDKKKTPLPKQDLASFKNAYKELPREDWKVLQIISGEHKKDILQVPPLWRRILYKCSSKGMKAKELEKQFFFPKGDVHDISSSGSLLQSLKALVGLNLLQEREDQTYTMVTRVSLQNRLDKLFSHLESYQDLSQSLSQYYSWCQGVMEGVYKANLKNYKKELQDSMDSISKIDEKVTFCEENPKYFWKTVDIISTALEDLDVIYQEGHEWERMTKKTLLSSLSTIEDKYQDLPLFVKLDLLNILKTILEEKGEKLKELLEDRRKEIDMFREFTIEGQSLSLPVTILVETYQTLWKEIQLLLGSISPGQGELTIRLSHENTNRESIAVSLGNRRFTETLKKIEDYELLLSKNHSSSLSQRYTLMMSGLKKAYSTVLSCYKLIERLNDYLQNEPMLYEKYVVDQEKELKNLEQNIIAFGHKAETDAFSLEMMHYSIMNFKETSNTIYNALAKKREELEEELLKRVDSQKLTMVNKAALYKEGKEVIFNDDRKFKNKETYQEQSAFVQKINALMDKEGERLCGSIHLWSAYQRLFHQIEKTGNKRIYSIDEEILELSKAGVIGVKTISEVTL